MLAAAAGPRKATLKPEDLPDEIVQVLEHFGRAVMEHMRAHRDYSLADHEDDVLTAWRTVTPAMLEAVLCLATT